MPKLSQARRDGLHRGILATVCCQLLTVACKEEAVQVGEEAVRELGQLDAFASLPMGLGSLALANALTGRHAEAADLLQHAPDAEPWLRTWLERAHAAVLAAQGEEKAAGKLAAEAGRAAMDASLVAYAILAFHDAVRYGHADLVVTDLDEATTNIDAALLGLMGDHARAQVAGDPEALDSVGRGFASMGAPQLAAQAFAHAAEAALAHDADHARRSLARSTAWARQADPFVAPATPDVPDPLTERELETVLLAATGAPSRAIADELFVSVRTVDNHLRRAYGKLGVSGRTQLGEALDALPTTAG